VLMLRGPSQHVTYCKCWWGGKRACVAACHMHCMRQRLLLAPIQKQQRPRTDTSLQ
jgi:hypothetical protein